MGKTHVLLANGKVFRANFDPLASMNEDEPDKTTLKTENRNRNEENGGKSSIVSPITGFRTQKPFRKPLDLIIFIRDVKISCTCIL